MNSSIAGFAIGCIMNQSAAHLMSFSSVFYNNQTNLPAIGSGSSTDGSEIAGFTCGALYSQILNFPKNVWGGNRLLVEPNYAYGDCNCPTNTPTNKYSSNKYSSNKHPIKKHFNANSINNYFFLNNNDNKDD